MDLLRLTLHWAHLVAVVSWIGGIVYLLTVLLPAMPKLALRDRANFVPIILGRFIRLVWISIATLVASGLYRMFAVWNVGEATFWSLPQGQILTTKLVLAAALIGVALSVTFNVVPKTVAHVSTHKNDSPDAYACLQCAQVMGGMKRHLKTALALALVIIFLAAKLRGA